MDTYSFIEQISPFEGIKILIKTKRNRMTRYVVNIPGETPFSLRVPTPPHRLGLRPRILPPLNTIAHRYTIVWTAPKILFWSGSRCNWKGLTWELPKTFCLIYTRNTVKMFEACVLGVTITNLTELFKTVSYKANETFVKSMCPCLLQSVRLLLRFSFGQRALALIT